MDSDSTSSDQESDATGLGPESDAACLGQEKYTALFGQDALQNALQEISEGATEIDLDCKWFLFNASTCPFALLFTLLLSYLVLSFVPSLTYRSLCDHDGCVGSCDSC